MHFNLRRKYINKLLLLLFAYILFIFPAIAQTVPISSEHKQWFIQIGAFASVENAINHQQKVKGKLNGMYSLEREFSNYVSIQPNGNSYRVLIGPYPTKNDAQAIQLELSDYLSNAVITRLEIDSYFNYQYNHKLTWRLIDGNVYKKLIKNSLSFLDLSNFELPSLSKKVSLIAHTQIQEEILDFKEAQALLKKEHFSFQLENPENWWITGYEVHGKYTPAIWPFGFYAYYPSEKLVVLWGEGESLLGLSVDTGELTWKLPSARLYSPDKNLRVSGEYFGELGGGRSYIELYDGEKKRYIELMDLGIISPWFLTTSLDGFAWLSNNEVIFELHEYRPTEESFAKEIRYYRVEIDRL